MTEPSELIYMSAKQVAEYLDLNEKKVYAMSLTAFFLPLKLQVNGYFPRF